MTIDRQTVEFVEMTSIVPEHWTFWFYAVISEDAPFSWGDNNRSMVTADDFARHCEERLDDSPQVKKWLKKIYTLGQMYIDLES